MATVVDMTLEVLAGRYDLELHALAAHADAETLEGRARGMILHSLMDLMNVEDEIARLAARLAERAAKIGVAVAQGFGAEGLGHTAADLEAALVRRDTLGRSIRSLAYALRGSL